MIALDGGWSLGPSETQTSPGCSPSLSPSQRLDVRRSAGLGLTEGGREGGKEQIASTSGGESPLARRSLWDVPGTEAVQHDRLAAVPAPGLGPAAAAAPRPAQPRHRVPVQGR